jgi:hypothetical protein
LRSIFAQSTLISGTETHLSCGWRIKDLLQSSNNLKASGENLDIMSQKRIFSEEHRANIGASRQGKPRSEETRAKLSAALLGKKRAPFSEEHKAKIAAARIGTKRPYKPRATNTPRPPYKKRDWNELAPSYQITLYHKGSPRVPNGWAPAEPVKAVKTPKALAAPKPPKAPKAPKLLAAPKAPKTLKPEKPPKEVVIVDETRMQFPAAFKLDISNFNPKCSVDDIMLLAQITLSSMHLQPKVLHLCKNDRIIVTLPYTPPKQEAFTLRRRKVTKENYDSIS